MKPANPYEAPKNVTVGKLARPWRSPLGIVAVGFLCLLLIGLLVSQPRCSHLFEEFDIALPAITRAALSPGLPLAIAILLVGTIVFEIVAGRWTTKWRIFAVIVSLAAAAVHVFGVAQAFMSVVRDLS